jgi:hypothetical protein
LLRDQIELRAGNYVRVQVLTPAGALGRDKQLGVVRELTEIAAAQARDATLAERTWVLITESPMAGGASTGTPKLAPTSWTPPAVNSPGTRPTLRMSRCRGRPDKISG